MVVLLFVLAVAIRAFFALARSALINMRRPRLVELEKKGVTSARAIQQLTENSSRLLATAEVGALLGLVLAAGIAALGFTPPALNWLRAMFDALPPEIAQVIAFLIVTFATALFLFVFGRLVPEALALRYTEPLALVLVRPIQVMSILLAPFVRFAVVLSNLLSIPMGGQKREGATLVTEEELKTMVDVGEEEGLIEEGEKEMILSVLDFGDTVAREVMVPRIAMVALDVNTPFDEVLDVVISAGHSRIPVYRGTIDEIIGILYAKDLLTALRDGTKPPLEQMLRPAYFTPESKRVIELLHELQKRRVHVSIVVDEYGGTAGLVTIEDILEEIVGEIQDEYDAEEPDIVPLPEGNGYILDAGMNIEDAGELLQVELPKGESDTLGGFIYDQLGKVPVVGEQVEHDGFIFEVLAVNDRRILKVKVTHAPHQPDAQQQAAQERPHATGDAAPEERGKRLNPINNPAPGRAT
ncbi:MAG: HlyC/CorC family transporter [Chloroflexi bacterium]|jgi:CBS domain containing-hemolysin-like protein|uniref:HlyC/CorC family transporter n=1 Tax=Candidatus Thermofonsia Clade 3 bacterium TaxID=2364212 RepID=A0A2M8QCH2_9CHLR|nr:hemolysin family protein [Candidatus Roseilinea sp. NK_OTU-006]PJF47505.1 MAG: HlyC/CorC family transporter [Candidatus Thermofonsia Clade 3 bacterium]RMG62808.1 MAG: HlyC/CorC family transporter [Chloroflexota bacterium]